MKMTAKIEKYGDKRYGKLYKKSFRNSWTI